MPTILIVDGNPEVRRAVRAGLLDKRADFHSREAVDGLDAVEKAIKLRPDLIILSLSMQRMNGLEAARKLRSMMSRVPIILFTLHASILGPAAVLGTGIDAVFSKTNLLGLTEYVSGLLQTG